MPFLPSFEQSALFDDPEPRFVVHVTAMEELEPRKESLQALNFKGIDKLPAPDVSPANPQEAYLESKPEGDKTSPLLDYLGSE